MAGETITQDGQILPAPGPRSPDGLGPAAYAGERAWLDEIAPARHAPWDSLHPEFRSLYRRQASAVATVIAAVVEARAAELGREAAAALNAGQPGARQAAARAEGWAQAAGLVRALAERPQP